MAALLLESLDKIRSHDHVGLMCRDGSERLAVAVPFLRSGLARGEKCLLLCSPAVGDMIMNGLRSAGVDVGKALVRGSLQYALKEGRRNAEEAESPEALVARLRGAVRQARTEKYGALRFLTDVAFVAGRLKTRERVLEFQARFHDLLSKTDSLSLCVHLLEELPPEILLDAFRAHPLLVWEGTVLENDYFVVPGTEPPDEDPAREIRRRLSHLAERQGRTARIRRQAVRLKRFREIAASLLAHDALSDLLRGITEGVIALGYRMCWIGMARPDGTVEPVAEWGAGKGYLKQVAVRWDDTPLGNGPLGRAIRLGEAEIVRDVARSRRFAPWREAALSRGYRSVAAVPLRERESVVGALAVFADEPDAFDREAIDELNAFALQASLAVTRAREVERLAESEQRYRAVVAGSNVLALEVDAEGRILLFNAAAEDMSGYRAEEVLGKDLFSLLIPPRERDRVLEEHRTILAGREKREFVVRFLTRGGQERLVSWNVKAVPSGREGGRTVVAIGVDVTDRVRTQEERERLRQSAVKARQMKAVGALAGGIAHDFNNLLGAIIGTASLIEARMDPADPHHPAVRRIRESAERGAELTNKLLGFARGGKYRVEALSLNEVVKNIVALVSPSFDKAVEVHTVLEPSLVPVEGDAGQLGHSVLELCLNARDAMPAGGTLTVETANVCLSEDEATRYHLKGPGDHALLVVRDTGEGMTEELLRRLFRPFFTTRRERGHSGMGLAMIYGIVKNHGGGIHVESAPGKGTAVRILLPAAGSREERPPAPAPAPEKDPCPRGTETVLIVDDEAAVLGMAAEMLSALGYMTIQAADGESACRLFRERRGEIALVLLDVVMPRMGGKETFRALRALSPDVPVLLSSGYTVEGGAREILDEGAAAFLQKPYDLASLARAVRSVLDSARAG